MVPSNVAMWGGVLIVLSLASMTIFTNGQVQIKTVDLYLFLLLFVILSASLINNKLSLNNTIVLIFAFFVIAFFSFALSQFKLSIYDLLFAIVILAFAQSLISLVQMYDDYRIFNLWFSYEPFRISGKPTGTFQQTNMLASFLSLSFLSVIVLIFQFSSRLCNRKKLFLYLALTLITYVVLSSGSRSAFVALIIPLLLYVFFKHRLLLQRYRDLLLIVLSVVLAIFILILFNDELAALNHAVEKTVRVSEGADARIHLYTSAIAMFLDAPFWGYGLGSYQDIFQAYYINQTLPNGLSYSEYMRMSHPHNELLYWMLQGGVLVLVAVVVFSIWYLRRVFIDNDSDIYFIVLLLPIIIQAMLSYPFGLSALHLFLMVLLINLSLNSKTTFKVSIIFKIGMLFLSAGLLMFSVYAVVVTYKSIYETYYFKNRMTLYIQPEFKDFEKKGYFFTASENPLFSSLAKESMHMMLHRAVKNQNNYDLNQYIKWCNNQRPSNRLECKANLRALGKQQDEL